MEHGCENVITFTGMREKGITDEQGTKNCLDCWKQVIGYAEEKKINLCLEHLNSRDNTHPMKGHPGYFGDDVDFCVDLIRKVAQSGVTVQSLSVQSTTLDDVFVHYTGRGLRDALQEANPSEGAFALRRQ